MEELDGIKAAKDSEITRKDREIPGLVAAAAKSQTRVQNLEEANATISEFCSTLEETGNSCRATIELLRGQLAELEEELREARATKNRPCGLEGPAAASLDGCTSTPTVCRFFSLGGGEERGDLRALSRFCFRSHRSVRRTAFSGSLQPFLPEHLAAGCCLYSNSGSGFVLFTLSARLQHWNACCYHLYS